MPHLLRKRLWACVMKKLALLLLLTPLSAIADGWQCWQEAAARYAVPIDLLYAVARVESGNNSKVVSKTNSNGSYDIGLMQINSMHLPMLRNYGISEAQLIANPCLNLHVGAWVMAQSIARYGYNWRAIGAYNAGTESKRATYARKVLAMLDRIAVERAGMKGAENRRGKE